MKNLGPVMGMVIILSAVGMGACGPGTPVPQPVVSESVVPTETPTAVPVLSGAEGLTPTLTPMPTATSTGTPTATPTPTATSTATPTPTPTDTPTVTPVLSEAEGPAPTATPVLPTDTPTPAYLFLPDGPAQPDMSHPCPGCPRAGAYIVGTVRDAGGNPLGGVRLVCYADWHRYPVVGSKGGGEVGQYDCRIDQANATFYVVVLDEADRPISPEAAVDFDLLVSCRYIQDWRRTY
jgi:hypothetical protein